MKSNAGNVRHDVEVTDGLGSQLNVPRGHINLLVIHNSTNTTTDIKGTTSTY